MLEDTLEGQHECNADDDPHDDPYNLMSYGTHALSINVISTCYR